MPLNTHWLSWRNIWFDRKSTGRLKSGNQVDGLYLSIQTIGDLYAQKLFAEEAAFSDTRQDEENSRRQTGWMYSSSGSPLSKVLHEDEAVGKVGLIADEH